MSTLRSMLGAAALAALALTAVGCPGKNPGGTNDTKADGGSQGGPGGPQTDGGTKADGGTSCAPSNRNDEIRLGLAPACEGCHLVGNKPFFASLTAFENGLVYDERYVKPGDPANSLLIQLLKGHAPGSYPQMPPGQPYDELVANGRVTLTLAQVEAWIRELALPNEQLEAPDPEAFNVRRLSAEEMVVSLMEQLGLTLEDFVSTSDPTWRNKPYVVNGGKLFVWPGDWAPGISTEYVSDSRSVERFDALGGGNPLVYRKRDVGFGPSAAQTLVQMSQAWCARAVDKKSNTAVLRYATLTDTSAKNPDAVRKNLRALYLRMLGQPPSEAEAKELYEQVYLPLEAQSTRLAWIGVCAALVRHPLWITY